MDETQTIDNAPRADTLEMRSGEGVHNKWRLHQFAMEQNSGWLPKRLHHYHDGRFINGELMEGYYDEFIPVTYDTKRGRVLKKDIMEKTTYCPECDVAARKYDGDTMCPECGLLCSDSKATDNLVRDPKAAGRMRDD